MEKLLTYGLKDGILTHVSKVPNGLECGCICANCSERLVAKGNIEGKTFKKIAHFAHYSGAECSGAIESAIHLLAKSIIIESRKIQLPDFHFDYDQKNSSTKYKELNLVQFDRIDQEQKLEGDGGVIIADIAAKKDNSALIIEFANTHFIDDEKRKKLRESNLSCIEVNLKNQTLDKNSLESFLLSKSQDIYWINNPKLERQYFEELKIKEQEIKLAKEKRIKQLKAERINVISIVNQKVRICPKKINFFDYFKRSRYYEHPVLMEIANGAYWNEILYGKYQSVEYIFFQGEKIHTSTYPEIQPPNDEQQLLRKGLKQIQERENLEARLCNFCSYSENSTNIDGKEYQLCKYKYGTGYIKDLK